MFTDLKTLIQKNDKFKVIIGKANPSLFGKPTGQTTLAKLKDPLISKSANQSQGKTFDQVFNFYIALLKLYL